MGRSISLSKKIILCLLVFISFSTFLSSSCGIFDNDERKAYRFALECVEDKMKYPNTATFPSFSECRIEKSVYGADIILDSYVGGRSFEYAWDVSGGGTCENALGMTLNYSFTVTVVLDEYGDFWCYKCVID